ncbi:MAG: c-type cytochrome [Bryobacteraceae bacterium]
MKLIFIFILLLASCQFVSAQSSSDDIAMTPTLSGAEMFKSWCASCHGAEGRGDGPAAKALRKSPADLTKLTKSNGGKFPTDRVRKFIDGTSTPPDAHGSREMPVWGSVLGRIDASRPGILYRVTALTSYVESIQAK